MIKWDEAGFSETGALFYQTTRRRILKAYKFQTEMLPIILCMILQNPSLVFRYIFVNSSWSVVHKYKSVRQMGKFLNMHLPDADYQKYCAVSIYIIELVPGFLQRRNRGFCSSRMWFHFITYVFPDVSKEPVTIVLNWRLSRIMKPWRWRPHFPSKSQQTLTPTTRRHIPENLSLHVST